MTSNVQNCARCGGDHRGLLFHKLTRPFAPPEAAPIVWTHYATCPTNFEPVLMCVTRENDQ